MGLQNKQDKTQYWSGLIEEWEASGLSQQRFCEKRDAKYAHFLKWRGRLNKQKKAGLPSSLSFVPIERTTLENKIPLSHIVIQGKVLRVEPPYPVDKELLVTVLSTMSKYVGF